MTTSTHPINPKTAHHRALHLATLDDLLREADRLAAAEAAGTLMQRGNWTLGQAVHHLAVWMDFAHDDYPPSLPMPPRVVRMFIRLRRNKFLNSPLPRGFRIPRVKDGTIGFEPTPTADARAHLARAVERLRKTAPTKPNAIFGPLTHDEWIKLQLRHAELHLGYFDFLSEPPQ